MERWIVLVVGLALGCGGGSSRGEGASSQSTGDERVEEVSPEALEATYERNARTLARHWSPDGDLSGLADQAMQTLRSYAADRGYVEVFLTLEVASPDWTLGRHQTTGEVMNRAFNATVIARFPDGVCRQYGATFLQEASGGDFSDALTTMGTGGGVPVPCGMAEVVAARANVAQ
ncbi:MAG: hypothetical protein KF901_17665 [Myxococcales bacterium]|nr:hypothetical protein [Myxococcales bacterium]